MKRHYKTKEIRNLNPGEFHDFFVLKKIKLPDNFEFFVLIDAFGEKHLLPLDYYRNYPICIDEYYSCHIDKINCQGRIFLEPKHPFFQLGKTYEFKVLDKINLQKKDEIGYYYRMQAKNGELAYLKADALNQLICGDIRECKIVKIKKAKVFIELQMAI